MIQISTLATRAFAVVLAIYVGIVVLLACFQRRMIYLPARGAERELIGIARSASLEPWRDPQSGSILGYRTIQADTPAANRLIVFHGNAGYALHRLYFARGFATLADGALWQVYLFEYPGYGARSGNPGEKEMVRAASDALTGLRRGDDRPVFVLGESIGSGVACALAAERPGDVAGLFLVTPFTSLADVAASHYPIFPVRRLLRDRYDNVAALTRYRGPVAFLAAGQDEVVPGGAAEKLHDGFAGPKRLWTQPRAGHNDLDYEPSAPMWKEVSSFLLSVSSPSSR